MVFAIILLWHFIARFIVETCKETTLDYKLDFLLENCFLLIKV